MIRAISGETVGPAVEGRARLEVAHLRLQIVELRRGNVGRVRDERVEQSGAAARAGRAGRPRETRCARASPCSAAFARATSMAAAQRSVPKNAPEPSSRASAITMAPEPVPTSATRAPGPRRSSAASTSVSVSGRGTSTRRSTRRRRDQNSRSPVTYASGMRRARSPRRRSYRRAASGSTGSRPRASSAARSKPGGVLEQHAGLEPRRLDADGGQPRATPIDRPGDGLDHSPPPLRASDWKWAASASIISWMSPSMKLSSR